MDLCVDLMIKANKHCQWKADLMADGKGEGSDPVKKACQAPGAKIKRYEISLVSQEI